jgi:hypothetical protein
MKHDRRTDSGSHPRALMAGFTLVTQQDVELRMSFHLSLNRQYHRL